MSELAKKAFITGSSRGIGAETAVVFAEDGWDVAVGATRNSGFLRKTVARLNEVGIEPHIALGDITVPESRAEITSSVLDWADGQLNVLVLNAAGGLERDKPASYGMVINHDAQVAMAQNFSGDMTPDANFVYITSHWAHWWDRGLRMPPFVVNGKTYDVVASSKNAGETALRGMIPELAENDIRFLVPVLGYVPDTIVGRSGESGSPDYVRGQEAIGNTPSAREAAEFILGMVNNTELPSGATAVLGADEETFLQSEREEQ
jgi:NAD(P)-dependent dehydrogenase (short-subunit alcohol dehydrogenase family)